MAVLALASCKAEAIDEEPQTTITEPSTTASPSLGIGPTTSNYVPDKEKINAIFENRAYSYTNKSYFYDSNITFNFDYLDSYFENSSYEISTNVAEFLSVPAACAYSKASIKELLEMLGYTDIVQYWYGDDPEDPFYWNPTQEEYSRAEFSIAKRKAKINNEDITIYATVVRGTRGLEWYGNFDVGNPFTDEITAVSNYYHPDYYKCANDYILPYLSDYITNDEDYDKETSRIWITGQSRGAAVSNVLGAIFSDENIISEEHTFVYTYGCPNTYIFDSNSRATDRAVYPNRPEKYKYIYNYNNPGDYITNLPLVAWGFERFGTDISMDLTTEGLEDMKYIFKEMLGEKYTANQTSADFVYTLSSYAPSFYIALTEKKAFMEALLEFVPFLAGDGDLNLSVISSILSKFTEDLEGLKVISKLATYTLSGGLASAHVPEGYYILVNMMYENVHE